MTKNPPHAGEIHPDGDELLYLVDGAVDVILDEAAGERCLGLQPGQAFVVPCGVWQPRDGQGTVPPLVFYTGAQPSSLAPPRPFQIRTRISLCESGP